MRIPLDHESETPLYQQIYTYLRQNILTGSLAPETRLPASRQFAQDLGVNRITIESAYSELESDGLIFSRVGSGTYVMKQNPLPNLPKADPDLPWPIWQQDIQEMNAKNVRVSPEAMLKTAGHPHPISFAGGVGDSYLFPLEDFSRVIRNIIHRDGMASLGYGEYNGYGPLRSTIAQVLANQGVSTRPENILVTGGSQQALSFVSQVLLKPGDTILVESPTYPGALDLFRAQRLKIVGVPVDAQGMQVEKLETLLQQYHPRLIYTIPNFQNPTGSCLSNQRRRLLINLADRYNVPILEDDFVGDLRYEGRPQPALKSLDPGGRVIYTGTFSKMLMPGLRVGYLVADGPVYTSLVDCKRANDLSTSSLLQRALEAYVTVGRYQAHLRRSCAIYRKRRDAMQQAIRRYLPPETHTILPQGGLYFWVRLPQSLSSTELLARACEEGVAFAPGEMFFPDGADCGCYMRLNFVMCTPEDIDEGLRRLGGVIKKG